MVVVRDKNIIIIGVNLRFIYWRASRGIMQSSQLADPYRELNEVGDRHLVARHHSYRMISSFSDKQDCYYTAACQERQAMMASLPTRGFLWARARLRSTIHLLCETTHEHMTPCHQSLVTCIQGTTNGMGPNQASDAMLETNRCYQMSRQFALIAGHSPLFGLLHLAWLPRRANH